MKQLKYTGSLERYDSINTFLQVLERLQDIHYEKIIIKSCYLESLLNYLTKLQWYEKKSSVRFPGLLKRFRKNLMFINVVLFSFLFLA